VHLQTITNLQNLVVQWKKDGTTESIDISLTMIADTTVRNNKRSILNILTYIKQLNNNLEAKYI